MAFLLTWKYKMACQDNWSHFNKTTQQHLIIYFIYDTCRKLNLTKNEKLHLTQTLNIALTDRIITKDDIIIKENRIQRIHGLDWNSCQRKFTVIGKPSVSKTKVKKENSDSEPKDKDSLATFSKTWWKNLEAMNERAYKAPVVKK